MSGQADPTGKIDMKMYEQMAASQGYAYGQMSPNGIVPKEYQHHHQVSSQIKDSNTGSGGYGSIGATKDYKDSSPVPPQLVAASGAEAGSFYRSYTPHSTTGL